MLAEFALTPSIFDEAAHTDPDIWRDQLRELGSNMFPRTAAWPIMISNLYAGSWHNVALTIAKAIKDHRARVLCEDLLRNAASTLVHRPALGDWPGEDSIMWGREAIASHVNEPIERILACKPAHDVLSQECRFIWSIEQVQEPQFWQDVGSPWSQTMKIGNQVDSLRKLCVHSEFLCLVTPHISGGNDDETDFALALIKSTLRRPAEYQAVEIEVHTEAPEKPASADYPQRLRNIVQNVSLSLRSALAVGQKVRLTLWPKLLDRYIIAGVYTELSDGSRARSPRWGVSMQHIARKSDDREAKPPTPWSLLTKRQLTDEFDRYCKAGVAGFSHSTDVTG
jgi:hypothetical protein